MLGRAAQGVRRRRCDVQRLGLLPHRLARRREERRQEQRVIERLEERERRVGIRVVGFRVGLLRIVERRLGLVIELGDVEFGLFRLVVWFEGTRRLTRLGTSPNTHRQTAHTRPDTTRGNSMFKGFKEFIMRGNVMDLAVAVVIGAAFTTVVNAVVNGIINPLIGAVFNAKSLDKTLVLEIPTVNGDTADIMFGALIGALIQFLVVAAVLYFAFVMPMNRLRSMAEARRKKGDTEPPDEPVTELDLLTEIRDLLARTEQPAGGRHEGRPEA
jgi:large conductance mechanosensitive channel